MRGGWFGPGSEVDFAGEIPHLADVRTQSQGLHPWLVSSTLSGLRQKLGARVCISPAPKGAALISQGCSPWRAAVALATEVPFAFRIRAQRS